MVVVRVQDGYHQNYHFGCVKALAELPGLRTPQHRRPSVSLLISCFISLLTAPIMLEFFDMMTLLGSVALSLAILVPLAGALVRFRAHYNPKGLQLDAEGGVQPHTGPVISSFFSMLKRVHRIEVGIPAYSDKRRSNIL